MPGQIAPVLSSRGAIAPLPTGSPWCKIHTRALHVCECVFNYNIIVIGIMNCKDYLSAGYFHPYVTI